MAAEAAAAALGRVADVEIDGGGVFKYVLLRVRPRHAGTAAAAKEVVRGHGWAEYHGEGRRRRAGGRGSGRAGPGSPQAGSSSSIPPRPEPRGAGSGNGRCPGPRAGPPAA